MSNTTWYILASTIPIAIIVMIAAFFITRFKIKKFSSMFTLKKNQKNLAFERKNYGQLLWKLKDKTRNPLDDVELEFLLNTILRNKYKTSCILNSNSDYEEKSIKKIANQVIVKQKYDFALFFVKKELNGWKNEFDKVYKNLNLNGMIAITNFKKRDKQIKELCNYLKLTGIKNEYQKVGKGLILIVK